MHPALLLTHPAGAFVGSNGKALPVPEGQLPNAGMRLFGGAQFHRAMAEFRLAVGGIQVSVCTLYVCAGGGGRSPRHRAMAEFRLAVGGIQVRVWKCGGVDDECALCVSQGFGM